jgi:plastocyanin
MTALRLPLFAALITLTTAVSVAAAELAVTLRSSKGQPVADAVVSLVPLDAPVPPPSPAKRTEIAQENQEYSTYVTVVQAGSTVFFPNKDTVQHHVYSLSKAKKFELPLYNPGQAESFVFDVSGVVTLGCNIHDWMLAYLVVVPTPYFAKSDGLGAASVTAPAGRYRLELWHPLLGAPISEEITLAEGAAGRREFTLTLKPDRRIRRGPAGKTAGYR